MIYHITKKDPYHHLYYTEEGAILSPTRNRGVFWIKSGGNWEAVEAVGDDKLLDDAVENAPRV